MSASPSPPKPWGRLELINKDEHPSMPDHHDLTRSRHCIGRVASRCDIQIQKQFISALHCIIQLLGKDDSGNPIVEIEDHSRYGTWVNDVKVGVRNKATLKNNFVINLTTPNSTALRELSYKFVVLPSGLTKENEELHAQWSADERSVAARTRKRTHEDIQSTQSPTRVVPSPPHQGPGKKVMRAPGRQQTRGNEASEPVSEPPSEHSTPATQQSALDSAPQASSPRAAGKRRSRPDVPAADSSVTHQRATLEAENERLRKAVLQQAIDRSTAVEQLKKQEEELKALREENEALKKAQEEELKSLRDEKTALTKSHEEVLAKGKAHEEEMAALTKSHEEELAKVKAQAVTELAAHTERAKKELAEVRQERDALKQTLADVLADPSTPRQVRTVYDLEVKILELKRSYQDHQDRLANQRQAGAPQTTPPSKKQLAQLERREQRARRMEDEIRKSIEEDFAEATRTREKRLQALKESQAAQLNLSGSSQSQDSVDAGNLHGGRRNNLQLSSGSNDNSEPSPGDLPQHTDAVDEETKSGAEPAGRPLFDIYGARSATADTSSSSGDTGTPTTLSSSHVHRSAGRDQAHNGESKEQGDEAQDRESKEQEDDAGGEETKGSN